MELVFCWHTGVQVEWLTIFCLESWSIDFFPFQVVPKSDVQQLNKSLWDRPDKTIWEMILENVPLALP